MALCDNTLQSIEKFETAKAASGKLQISYARKSIVHKISPEIINEHQSSTVCGQEEPGPSSQNWVFVVGEHGVHR